MPPKPWFMLAVIFAKVLRSSSLASWGTPLSDRQPGAAPLELFARLDVGSLILEGTTLGWRPTQHDPSLTDRLWVNGWVGAQFDVL